MDHILPLNKPKKLYSHFKGEARKLIILGLFDLGLKHMVTLKKNQIPNTSQDISFKQTLANAGINSPTFSNLWNNTYCSPDTAFDWTLPWPPEGKPTLDPFLINIGPQPQATMRLILFFFLSPPRPLSAMVCHSPYSKNYFHFL